MMRRIGKRLLRESTNLQRAYRWYRRQGQVSAYPDWNQILATEPVLWGRAKEAAPNGPKVLLATSMGGLPSPVILDSTLAVSLTLRGASVDLLLCDGALPACLMTEIGLATPQQLVQDGTSSYFCKNCYPIGRDVFAGLGLNIHLYNENVTEEERRWAEEEATRIPSNGIPGYMVDGIAVGEHALAGTLRFFATANLEGHPTADAVLRTYLRAALVSMFAIRRLIRTHGYKVVCGINGIYVPQGIIASVARREGCRVVTWNPAYRKRSFVFSHNDTYHHTLMTEPVSEWEDLPWTPEHEREIMDYLNSRRRGGRDWIVFHNRNSNEDLQGIAQAVGGVDFSRPCIGMLTNVAWDAQLHYPANAFPNMLDWILRTIEYFAHRPDLQLILRIHPAEVSGDIPSRQPVVHELHRRFPMMPKNVFVISPESSISTYAVMEKCNAVVIYGTKTGVELTSLGIPVIVAGEAWIRNKGITLDARSADHYCEILDQLPLAGRMSEETTLRARKYAYHFFFRRMIPVQQIEPTGGEPQFRLKVASLGDLLPGKDAGLDTICSGILSGTSFVYRKENHETRE